MATSKAEIILSGVDRTKAAFASVSRSIDSLKTSVGGIAGKFGGITAAIAGVTAGFAALENIKVIALLDQLDDLAEKSGVSVEKLSELRFAGESTGTSFETLTGGLGRLSKQMAAAAGGNKEAIATFEALGVEVANADGTLRSADDVLRDVATRFASYEDGAAKAALAQRLFGKSGADMIPLLNQGAAGISRLADEARALGVIYDSKTAKAAADFNDNLTKIKLASEAASVSIAGPLIQSLARLSAEFLEAKKNGGLLAAGLASYRKGVGEFWSGEMFGGGAPKGKSTAEIQAFVNSRGGPSAGGGRGFTNPQVAAPVVQDPDKKTPKAPADDPTKKLLDNELKNFQRVIDQERDLMASRNEFLNLYNGQGLISFKDYYDQRQAILDEATTKQIKAYDDQVKALQNYLAKAPKATDRAETEGKISEILEKRAKTERDAGTASIKLGIDREKANEDYQESLGEINAKILEMQGNLAAAAAIRFDAQYDGLLKTFNANNNAQAVAMVKSLKEMQVAQAQITKLTESFSLVQGDLDIAEQRITIARERGTMGEIQSLVASGKARREAVALMQAQLAKFQAIDAAARTPEQAQAIERLKLQLESLSATIDPLADKINTMFGDAAGNAFGDFITGTKTAKEAFKDFASTVINELARMAAKDLAKSIFGGDSGGGIGGALSKALGGSGGSSGNSGGGSSGALGSLVSWFSGLMSFDVGTDYVPEDMIAEIHKGERIIPAAQNKPGAMGNTYINIPVEGRIDRETKNQIANSVSLEQRRARRLA